MVDLGWDIIPVTRQQLSEYRKALDAERQHVAIAHAKILQQREQLRILNDVIARRKRSVQRLRSSVYAVKKLHRPVTIDVYDDESFTVCTECCTDADGSQTWHCADYHTGEPPCWPCRTHRALHVESPQ